MRNLYLGVLATLALSQSLTTFAWAGELENIFTVSEAENETYLDIGVAGVLRDAYVGSDEVDYLVLPYATGEYKGRFFVNPALGAGIHFINNDKFRVSAAAGYSLGRDDEDTPFVAANDAFKVDASFTGNVAVRYLLPFASLDVIGTIPVSGDLEGARLDTLLTTELNPTPNFRITPGVRATFMTHDWLNTLYEITPQQAIAAGLSQTLSFSDGGLSTLGAHTAAYFTISEDYELVGIINYSLLVGDVKDSPLTPRNSGLTAAIGISRTF